MRTYALIVLSIALLAGLPAKSVAAVDVGIAINIGPPAIPVYAQPPPPAPNYIWTPGYWAWGPAGYYWVPGTWVLAPAPGLVWTPGYWSWNNGVYVWSAGYWAPQVGFYGGIDYGAGYYGNGYVGGQWQDGVYRYNTAVTNVNETIVRNVYVDRTVIVRNTTINRVSYNGGPGGIDARPTGSDFWVDHFDRHEALTSAQSQNQSVAEGNRNFLARVNHGDPVVAAVERPLTSESHPSQLGAPAKRHVEDERPVTTVHHNAVVPHPQIAHYQQATHSRVVTQPHVPAHPPVERHTHTVTRPPAPHPHATRAPHQ